MTRPRTLLPLLLLWALLVAASFVHFALTEKTGSGFTRGMNRLEVFLRWQAAALVVAVVSHRLAAAAG